MFSIQFRLKDRTAASAEQKIIDRSKQMKNGKTIEQQTLSHKPSQRTNGNSKKTSHIHISFHIDNNICTIYADTDTTPHIRMPLNERKKRVVALDLMFIESNETTHTKKKRK